MAELSRRRLLAGAATALAVARLQSGQTPVAAAPYATNPFTLGVASGDPTEDSVVLWTRLALDPLNGGGMGGADVDVHWEVATDAAFGDIVAHGVEPAVATLAHSVHVEVSGLEPDRWYHYRFDVGGQQSAVGRTRTTPSWPDRTPLRLGAASCQAYCDGHYTAHAHLAAEGCDVIAFLGDYIYEGGGKGPVRTHASNEADTLVEYRNRYATYKLDPDLQASHAACPWVCIWDDHEVDNNYAGATSQDGADPATFLARRAEAYQAWWEHLPVRLAPPSGPDLAIYRRLRWGSLATVHLLDTRQYRSDQACGDALAKPCAGWDDPVRTLLGADQEQWFAEGVGAAGVVWDVVAQQIVFAPMPIGASYNMDQWDGYPAQRDRAWALLREAPNPLVLSGDIHLGAMVDLHRTLGDVTTDRLGTELVVGSIASRFSASSPGLIKLILEKLAWWRHVNAADRGYVVVDLTESTLHAELRVVSTTAEPTATVRTSYSLDTDAVAVPAPPPSTTTTTEPSTSSTSPTSSTSEPPMSSTSQPSSSSTSSTSSSASSSSASPTSASTSTTTGVGAGTATTAPATGSPPAAAVTAHPRLVG